MTTEMLPFDYSRQIANGMDYRFYMEKALSQDNTRSIVNAIKSSYDSQNNVIEAIGTIGAAQVAAINNQTNMLSSGFDNINRTLNIGFSNINNSLVIGFENLNYQLGELGAMYTAGSFAIIDATIKMSEAVCERLDILADIANNPRRTEAREFYRDGVKNYLKGFYEEARDFLKQALEKDKTDYRSWYLLGIIYLRGKGEYCDVINLDNAIYALTNAAKYFTSEISEYNKIISGYDTSVSNLDIVLKSFDISKKVELIKEIKIITGLGLMESKNLVESVQPFDIYGNPLEISDKAIIATNVSIEIYKEISHKLNAFGASLESYPNPNPKPLAAEILFYLGQAKRFKSNELDAVGKHDEAKNILFEAQNDYEKSWSYSDKMLESQYNIAKCKVLLGDIESALSDLYKLIKIEKAYIFKIKLDSDFGLIRESFNPS